MKVIYVQSTVLKKSSDILQQIFDIILFLLFFFTLVHTICLCYLFGFIELAFNFFSVPIYNFTDPSDWRKFRIIDVGMMANTDERFVNIRV